MTLGLSPRAHTWAALITTLLVFVSIEWVQGSPPNSPERILHVVLFIVAAVLIAARFLRKDA